MTEPRTIVTWVWSGSGRDYGLRHAAILAEHLGRHMVGPFRLVVFSDEPGEVPGAEVRPIPEGAQRVAHVRTPEGGSFPSSYRRLWLFSEEAREVAPVVLMVDVDVVVTGDWSHLWAHEPEADFMGWRPGQLWGSQENRVGGGVWRLRTGTHPEVWSEFVRDPAEAIKAARGAGYRGSDQAWISHKLAGNVPVWPSEVGIRSVRDFNRDRRGSVVESIPDGTCMVHFNGALKPWEPSAPQWHPWLSDIGYRVVAA